MTTGKRQLDATAHIYIDESGNSGPNLLDISQPVYVLGGWLVPRIYVSTAEQAVRDLASKSGSPSQELHGVKFLKTTKGQMAFYDFLRAMGKAGGLPVYTIAEKRYWIAGKVVETYLDSLYNPAVPW